jgi:hypothetical protein
LPTEQRAIGMERALITTTAWQSVLPHDSPWITTSLLAVDFQNVAGGSGAVFVTARYSSSYSDANLSEDLLVALPQNVAGPTTLYLAVYDRADESIRFRGIEVAASDRPCLTRIARVQGIESTPLLLTTRLGADWRGSSLAQHLR